MNEEIRIRPHNDTDTDFIYASWLHHYRFSSDFARNIRTHLYYEFHHKVIERILERKAKVRIACLKDDPDVIVGYLVYEGQDDAPVIHFCFVKKAFRQMGVAKSLVQGLALDNAYFTHRTKDCSWLIGHRKSMSISEEEFIESRAAAKANGNKINVYEDPPESGYFFKSEWIPGVCPDMEYNPYFI